MEPLTVNLLGVLEEATYTVRREGERVVFSPAPPPEHRPTLTAWKHALPHALEEGKRIPARELLRLERLTCILPAREGVPEPVWATFYYPAQKEPERVLAPVPDSPLPSLLPSPLPSPPPNPLPAPPPRNSRSPRDHPWSWAPPPGPCAPRGPPPGTRREARE